MALKYIYIFIAPVHFPARKLRVRLWPCKSSLGPPVILYYRSFKGDTSAVVLDVLCLGVEFLCGLCLMCVFIF